MAVDKALRLAARQRSGRESPSGSCTGGDETRVVRCFRGLEIGSHGAGSRAVRRRRNTATTIRRGSYGECRSIRSIKASEWEVYRWKRGK